MAGLVITLIEIERQQQQQQQQGPGQCTRAFVQHLLSSPGLIVVLPEPVAHRLLGRDTLAAILQASSQLGREGAVRGGAAAALLGNISQLLLGTPSRPPASDAASLLQLPPSPHLADRTVAAAFAAVVIQLLPAAAAGAPLTAAQAGVVCAQLGLLTAQGPVLQLLAVLSDADMPLFAGLCLHLLQDLPDASALASGSKRGADQQTGGGAAALNTLAFAPRVLPALWRWLSVNLGVPLEAPAAARLGLDVDSVAGGCGKLSLDHALVLGVFCRWAGVQ
jgi:hypothetical protein